MSTISLPAGLRPTACSFRLAQNARVSASPFGGSEQVVDLLNDRWLVTLELPARDAASAAAIDAFLAALRGPVNVAAIGHYMRPVPRGTARGTILVNGAVSQGAGTIVVDGISPSNGTLLAGDLLGVGGQLVMVAADVTASGGAATVTLANRLRAGVADNAAVTWSNPTILCRLMNQPAQRYSGVVADGVVLDLAEVV